MNKLSIGIIMALGWMVGLDRPFTTVLCKGVFLKIICGFKLLAASYLPRQNQNV